MPHPHAAYLPAHPSIEQQRKRAKDLLAALRAADATAIDRFRTSHPRLAHADDAALRGAARLADAQLVVAREYGFTSWPRLHMHIAELNGESALPCHPFETDLEYYRGRAAGLASVHATGERNALRLIRRLHPAFADADEDTIRNAAFTQADAELVLARDHGFADWDALAAHVAAMASGQTRVPFREAFLAIQAKDEAKLAGVLHDHPDLVNARGTNGNRPLTLAVSMGRDAIVARLLSLGADPDLPNDKGWTALHAAAYADPEGEASERHAILERLLAAGASVEAEAYGDGGTPLMVALFWGHVSVADRLAEEAVTPLNLRVAAALGRVDLMTACFASDGSLVPAAGQHREFHRPHSGFPPWQPRDDAQEVLDEALGWAARSGRIDAMKMLLDRGARIDSEPYNGTALHWAIARQQTETAAWLLDRGATIDQRASFGGVRGVTPLHIAAAWRGSPAGARLLLDRGADRTATDPEHGGTPAGWARHHGNPAIAAMIEEATGDA